MFHDIDGYLSLKGLLYPGIPAARSRRKREMVLSMSQPLPRNPQSFFSPGVWIRRRCWPLQRGEGFEIVALSFDYGQRHAREVACAGAFGQALPGASARHETMKIDLRAFWRRALLTANIPVPKDHLGPHAGES